MEPALVAITMGDHLWTVIQRLEKLTKQHQKRIAYERENGIKHEDGDVLAIRHLDISGSSTRFRNTSIDLTSGLSSFRCSKRATFAEQCKLGGHTWSMRPCFGAQWVWKNNAVSHLCGASTHHCEATHTTTTAALDLHSSTTLFTSR